MALRSRQVLNWIVEYILSQGMHIGDVLPAELDVAEELDVGRSSVREAFAALKAFGVAGLAAALKNGLSDEENNVLIDAEDSLCIVSLILKGLQRQMLDKE